MENNRNKKEQKTNEASYKKEWFIFFAIIFVSLSVVVSVINASKHQTQVNNVELDENIPTTATPQQFNQILPPATTTATTTIAEALRAGLENIQKKASSTENFPVQIAPQNTEKSIADIVAEWTPRVTLVVCMWRDPNTGQSIQIGRGSGTIYNFIDGFKVITNKHVLVSEQYAPNDCTAIFPQNKDFTVYFKDRDMQVGTLEDYGYLRLPNDPDLSKFNNNYKVCSTNSVSIGDKLVVLGYPVIGGNYGITATEGIVSAIDPNYYLTSAKIDGGNSGGAAILIKDNCYLGIPSSSKVGEIESMGRILKASFVIN